MTTEQINSIIVAKELEKEFFVFIKDEFEIKTPETFEFTSNEEFENLFDENGIAIKINGITAIN